jgi:P-type Ca2+ transporter type 2C
MRVAETTLDREAWHTIPGLDAVKALHVERASGLTSDEADARLAELGPNRLTQAEAEPRRRAFVREYRDPIQIVLLAAGIGSLTLGELATGLVVLSLTLINAALGLHQDGKPAAAVAMLQKKLTSTARIRRDGQLLQLPGEQLVPGDMVLVEAGDIVPADGRLVDCATLEVDESALTGESVPVAKGVEVVDHPTAPLGDRTDMVYMSTTVTRGTGEFVITATGMSTEIGHISYLLRTAQESETPLRRQLTQLMTQILAIAGGSLVASIALNLSRGQELKLVFTSAVAFAIAAIPTGLPVVVTTILARGTQVLARANAIVKRLWSTEMLGSTSALNADKTGTLTLNQMTAVEMTLAERRYSISGHGYSTQGRIKRVTGQPEVPLEPFMLPMALASDAVVSNGELIGDPTEGALVVLAEKGGLDVVATREACPRIAELPFDAAYKLMATFHRMTDDSGAEVVRCFVKGAPDQILARARSVLDADLRSVRVTVDFRGRYLDENTRLASRGLRVMGTARRDFAPDSFDPDADLLPLVDDLTLLTLVGIVDPPRPQAKAAIAKARAAGIQLRMITGDHPATAEAIARELGLQGRTVTGAEFGAMSDEEAQREIDGIGVIGRVTPEHMVRLVETLKANGHVVAMTGDGVNDAPALEDADIGIAMGIAGTDVSKEAAVMIVGDDDLSTVVRAIESGRGLHDNLVKYIRFQVGTLAGMILTFLGASVFNLVGGLPFLPLQILYVTFTTQVFQSVGLAYEKPAEGLMRRRPRPIDEPILARASSAWIAIVGGVHAAATLGVIAIAEHAYGTTTARTMGLVTFGLLNLLYSFTTRYEDRSVFSLDTFADRTFLIASAASFAAIVIGTQTRLFERMIETTSLDFGQWLLCLGAAATIVIASEIRKLPLRHGRAGAEG